MFSISLKFREPFDGCCIAVNNNNSNNNNKNNSTSNIVKIHLKCSHFFPFPFINSLISLGCNCP